MSAPIQPAPELKERVVALTKVLGLKGAARALGKAEGTIARILAGLPITLGTQLEVSYKLTEIEKANAKAAAA